MSNMEVDAQKQRIKDFLQTKLTRAERLVVVLYYYDELTMREIAKVLKLPDSKVSQMKSSIIARCKAYVHKKQ